MLHTGLVVHQHIFVVAFQLAQLRGKQIVNKAIAALALGPAHNDQIKVIILDQCGVELVIQIFFFAHAWRDWSVVIHIRLCDDLADIPQGGFHFHTQDLIQIGVCVCIDCQNRSLTSFAKPVDHHSGDRCLPCSAFSCKRYCIRHIVLPRYLFNKSFKKKYFFNI